MAITKILARKGRLDIGINYILNGDKTEERPVFQAGGGHAGVGPGNCQRVCPGALAGV